MRLAAEVMILSKFIEVSEANLHSITAWELPKIEQDALPNTPNDEPSSFIDLDMLQNAHHFTADTAPSLAQPYSNDYASAKEQGYQDGYQQGKQEAEAQYAQALADDKTALASLIQQLQQPYNEVQQQIKQEVAELAILIAEKMLFKQLTLDPDGIVPIVEAALKLLPSNDLAIELYFNQADYDFISEHCAFLEGTNYKLHVDATLLRGSVKITSEKSDVDLSIQQRMQQLIDEFFVND